MNTQTHLLIAAAAFARPNRPRITTAALLGGLIPDLSLYAMVAWERFAMGESFETIFRERYWSPFWQSVFAVDNSAPLYALALVLALAAVGGAPSRAFAEPRTSWIAPLIAFCGAALLHIALDLPLHHDDGRAHFQPFTDWVFQSPVSYWDHRRHGDVVGVVETALVLGLCVLLWRRFRGAAARALILLAFTAQIATSAMWSLLLA